jgi:Flp pilus assembly protein TadB
MPVLVLFAVAVVLLVCLLIAADRAVKAIKRGRRLRAANERLTAAAAQAEVKDRQRRAAEQASGALTSVMPTIHDMDTRHVD